MKPRDTEIPLALLHQHFIYVPTTGLLLCRGKAIGTPNGFGYLRASIIINGCRRRVLIHRICWALMTGTWPERIDHRDGNRSNNKWSNLREATSAQNKQNKAKYRNNTSGFTGVSKNHNRWRAAIKANGQLYVLGYFATVAEAHQAYLRGKLALHPFQPVPRPEVEA